MCQRPSVPGPQSALHTQAGRQERHTEATVRKASHWEMNRLGKESEVFFPPSCFSPRIFSGSSSLIEWCGGRGEAL